jgi:hypothetical protein
MLMARHGRQAATTSQLKYMTQATTDTGMCNVREFCAMCVPPKTKELEQNSRVENAT